jgi:hypothetical protein
VIKNDLSENFFALKNHHGKKLVLYKKIAGISLLSREYLCCNTFMSLLHDVVSFYKGITIDNVVSLNVYENPSFCCTLFVFKNGITTQWLSLKLSSIKNSGFGVFSLRYFKKNKLITCYLGEVNENPSDEEYTFKKINGKPVKFASGLLEDYWFGHQIQHGSGNQLNVTLTTGYETKAKKDIEIGEELFLDYNRSIVCGKCKAESIFYDLCFKKSKKCNFCGNMCLKLKKCINCEACFICLQSYDNMQIKL